MRAPRTRPKRNSHQNKVSWSPKQYLCGLIDVVGDCDWWTGCRVCIASHALAGLLHAD